MQKKHIKNIVIIFIVVLVLELTVFNFNSYRVLSSKNSKTFTEKDFEYSYHEDDGITFVEIAKIDEEIKTVHLEIENWEYVDYQFFYTDETAADLTSTPSKTYIDGFENSKYIATYLSRKNRSYCNQIIWRLCRIILCDN